MQLSKLHKDQRQVTRVLWFALCLSNFVFLYLVSSGLIKQNTVPNDNFWYYPAAFAALICIFNFQKFKKLNSLSYLKSEYSKIDLENIVLQPQFQEGFKLLNDNEKKKFYLHTVIANKSVLNWALCESVSTIGLVAIIVGMPTEYFYNFFVIAIFLLVYMFPKYELIIKKLD